MKAKTERNLAIVEYCKSTILSLSDIGIIYGITKQRVWAIKKAYQSHCSGQQRGRRQLLVSWVRSLFSRHKRGWR